MKLHRLSLFAGATVGALITGLVTTFDLPARPTEAQMDLQMAVQKTQAMVVAYQLDNSGFHDLDVQLNAGQMVPGALGKVRKARIAIQTAMWPAELQDRANHEVAKMMELEAALRDENVAAAAPHATEVHDGYHDLSDAVYAWLSTGQAPAPMEQTH